jgi:hypothetical protein
MFDENYDIYQNDMKFKELKAIGYDGGMDNFIKNLREKIILPTDVNLRPHTKFIKKANSFRGW